MSDRCPLGYLFLCPSKTLISLDTYWIAENLGLGFLYGRTHHSDNSVTFFVSVVLTYFYVNTTLQYAHDFYGCDAFQVKIIIFLHKPRLWAFVCIASSTNATIGFWFGFLFNIPVNNVIVMLERSNCFLGIYQYFGELKVFCSRTLHGGRGVRTLDLSLRRPTLYHCATAPP